MNARGSATFLKGKKRKGWQLDIGANKTPIETARCLYRFLTRTLSIRASSEWDGYRDTSNWHHVLHCFLSRSYDLRKGCNIGVPPTNFSFAAWSPPRFKWHIRRASCACGDAFDCHKKRIHLPRDTIHAGACTVCVVYATSYVQWTVCRYRTSKCVCVMFVERMSERVCVVYVYIRVARYYYISMHALCIRTGRNGVPR